MLQSFLTWWASRFVHCCTNKSRQPSGFEDEHSCFCCLLSSAAVQAPEHPQDQQESKHKKLFMTGKTTGPFCWYLEQVPVTHLSFQLLVTAPCAALHRAFTFFSESLWLLPFTPTTCLHYSSRDCSDLPTYFFLLILSSSRNKATLHPNSLYYSKSRANWHWKTEGQRN